MGPVGREKEQQPQIGESLPFVGLAQQEANDANSTKPGLNNILVSTEVEKQCDANTIYSGDWARDYLTLGMAVKNMFRWKFVSQRLLS